MPSDLESELQDELQRREDRGLRRGLSLPDGVDFTSNDYLGLRTSSRVRDSAREAIGRYGVGSGASRLLRGHFEIHAAAEQRAAEWAHAANALLCASGWQANAALLTALGRRGDAFLSDELNHASLIDAMRLSRASVTVYPHCDVDALERRLSESMLSARRRFIVSDAIFSMDGDPAPVEALLGLAERYDAYLILDEAHAIGVLGPDGAGLGRPWADHPRMLARVLPGGKALGASGAFVVGSSVLIDTIINFGRSFIYTTGAPPATAAALAAAIDECRSRSELRERACANADLFRSLLGLEPGVGPICKLVYGDEHASLHASTVLRREGFDVRAVRPPTVPPGTSRIRVVCRADHSEDEIRKLAETIRVHCPPPEPTRHAMSISNEHPNALVVIGTDTEIGKTVTSALIVRALRRSGRVARYLKPVQTGEDSDTLTVSALAELEPEHVVSPVVQLPLPASIDQAADHANTSVRLSEVVDGVRARLSDDPKASWVLETAGGLLVPMNAHEDQADLLRELGFPCVLVARSSLGTLNHTRLTLEAAARRGLEVRGLFLVGDPHPANEATLRNWAPGLRIIRVPFLETVSGRALDRWLESHDVHEVFA